MRARLREERAPEHVPLNTSPEHVPEARPPEHVPRNTSPGARPPEHPRDRQRDVNGFPAPPEFPVRSDPPLALLDILASFPAPPEFPGRFLREWRQCNSAILASARNTIAAITGHTHTTHTHTHKKKKKILASFNNHEEACNMLCGKGWVRTQDLGYL